MKRPPPSLQARALGWLAQRERSRAELRRKLLRVALQHARADDHAGGDACDDSEAAHLTDVAAAEAAAAQVDALLDRLQAQGLLSEERFIESRVRVRAASLGTRRIQLELSRHRLKLPAQPLQQLRESELQRATQLWQRKFGVAPVDARERARQARFMAARGFSGEVIARLLSPRRALPAEHADDD